MKVTHTNAVAIQTSYVPANHISARIRVGAMGDNKPVMLAKYDEQLSEADNHENAMHQYVQHLGWNWKTVNASKAYDGYVFTKGVE